MSAPSSKSALPPGGTIGILGGGQLGRMLALAAARLGLKCHIYAPEGDTPAAQVSDAITYAEYDDTSALELFARSIDVVTYEFENVPRDAAETLARHVPVRPSARALEVCQDRVVEKTFLNDAGIRTARFAAVATLQDLETAAARIGLPAILKTRRFGYDGKGQTQLHGDSGIADARRSVGEAPAILEALVPFDAELSIIIARGLDGTTACYDPARNVHENHILARSEVPAGISDALAADARAIAENIVNRLDYVGVMGVELFFIGANGGELYVNELAPRVHNSGHWTMDACGVDQFEQHIRAVAGWPLGSPERHHNAVMQNLLGSDIDAWQKLASEPGTAIHLYGKGETRLGRKMGHVNRLSPLGG